MGAGDEKQSWASAHRGLTAVLATATAIVGLATGVLTLRDQLFSGDDEPAGNAPAAQAAALTPQNVARLSDDVQLSRYEELLGPAASKRRLQNDEWLASTWESPDIAVTAFSNRDEQVVAYTVTSLGPDFTPLAEFVPGGIRLRESVFADLPDAPTGTSGVFPPNGRWSYEEYFLGGGATQGKSTVLAASFAANADDEAATQLGELGDCLPFSIFETAPGCPPDRVQALRSGLRVTSMTVGEASALEALSQDGALFFPEPDSGS
jgi:hypothetical protein